MNVALPAELQKVGLSTLGLRLQPGMAFEEWAEIGVQLARWNNASGWAIGDWFFYGEWEYGSKYEEAAAATGLSHQTLADLKYVAGRFEPSRRRENLSLSHHREIAPKPLEEQDRWLDQAEAEGWNREQLRSAIAAERQAIPVATRAPQEPTGVENPVEDWSESVVVLPGPEQLAFDVELGRFAERLLDERRQGIVLFSDVLRDEMQGRWSQPVQVRLSETSPGLFEMEARTPIDGA